MLNTHMITGREVPWWAIGAPAIGVPLMVALLAVAVPKSETPVPETPVDGMHQGATTEQVEREAPDHASGPPAHCSERPSSS